VTYAQCKYSGVYSTLTLYTETCIAEVPMIWFSKKINYITHPRIEVKETKNNRSTETNDEVGVYKQIKYVRYTADDVRKKKKTNKIYQKCIILQIEGRELDEKVTFFFVYFENWFKRILT